MQVGQFPASAASSLIEGYCDDFVSLAAMLAQTLEQVAMRGIDYDSSRPSLERVENGMRQLADAIRGMLEKETGRGARRRDANQPITAQPTSAPLTSPSPTAPPVLPEDRAGSPQPSTARPQPPEAPRTQPPPSPPAARSVAASSPTRTARPAAPSPRGPTGAPVSASAAAPRAQRAETLKGTNRSMPLLSVFQFLGRMRKSGTVHVYIQEETLAFEFVNGAIEFTASDRCPVAERLGELLVELGFCTREALAPILAKVGVSSAHRLGHLVIEGKLVTNGQVLEGLEAQVKRRFQRVCTDVDAAYEFEEGRRMPGDGRIRIAPFELSFEPGRSR